MGRPTHRHRPEKKSRVVRIEKPKEVSPFPSALNYVCKHLLKEPNFGFKLLNTHNENAIREKIVEKYKNIRFREYNGTGWFINNTVIQDTRKYIKYLGDLGVKVETVRFEGYSPNLRYVELDRMACEQYCGLKGAPIRINHNGIYIPRSFVEAMRERAARPEELCNYVELMLMNSPSEHFEELFIYTAHMPILMKFLQRFQPQVLHICNYHEQVKKAMVPLPQCPTQAETLIYHIGEDLESLLQLSYLSVIFLRGAEYNGEEQSRQMYTKNGKHVIQVFDQQSLEVVRDREELVPLSCPSEGDTLEENIREMKQKLRDIEDELYQQQEVAYDGDDENEEPAEPRRYKTRVRKLPKLSDTFSCCPDNYEPDEQPEEQPEWEKFEYRKITRRAGRKYGSLARNRPASPPLTKFFTSTKFESLDYF